jgi:hypothetical protein
MVLQMEQLLMERTSAYAARRPTPRRKSIISVLPADNSAYAEARGAASAGSPPFQPANFPGVAEGWAAGCRAGAAMASNGDAMSMREYGFREFNLQEPDLLRPEERKPERAHQDPELNVSKTSS